MGLHDAVQDEFWTRDKAGRRGPNHPVVRALFEPRAQWLASLVENPSESRVLDVGCGNGFLTVPLARYFGEAVGVDSSEAMLAIHPGEHTVCASADALPFEDNSFDLVVASHLLHHLDAPCRERAVNEMGRVARRAVVCYEPNRNNPLMALFGLVRREERMSLRFSRRYLRSLLAKLPAESLHSFVEGTLVPNKAPQWWIPISRGLDRTPLKRLGFYVGCFARLNKENKE